MKSLENIYLMCRCSIIYYCQYRPLHIVPHWDVHAFFLLSQK